MDTHQTPAGLNEQFTLPAGVHFEPGNGGLVHAIVDNPVCKGSAYLHGAHVTAFQPVGHKPVLFMSKQSAFAPGKAIRGGVPVCFPWFGPHATDQSAPAHGPARITEWRLQEVLERAGDVSLRFTLAIDPFAVDYLVTFGKVLSMTLSVKNTSAAPATFEAALHTYFVVSDIKQIQITGLEGVDYLDKVDTGKRKNQGNEAIRFIGETDRVYLDTRSACVLTDPGMGRKITVEKSGSDTTVVWNPWIDKAKKMPDFGDDEWPGMACIETANAGPNAVMLAPGNTHSMNATIRVTGQ